MTIGVKADGVQIGQNPTATQNFVLTQNADGTCKLARGNDGATTQDILTVDAAGLVTMTQGITPATTATQAVQKGQLDAGAGHIGELQEQTLASGAAVSLTTATALSIKSILLTAGTWDITGMAGFVTGATTNTTQFLGSISSTDNALGVEKSIGVIQYTAAGQVNVGQQFALPTIRVTPAVSTTYYLVLRSTFSVSTTTGYGNIRATRVAL